jgi:hypothetical protein
MAVKLTVTISPEDGERLMQAFKEGKLTELGILDVKVNEPQSREPSEQKWTGTESERRKTPNIDDVPPHS